MTDQLASRTRRALLTAALGAGAATVASAIARPLPANAADGETVFVGGEYFASSVTKFDTQTTGQIALWGNSTSYVGVQGTSGSNIAVYGYSTSYVGVQGASGSNIGVQGSSTSYVGVRGQSTSNIGVRGDSSSNIGVVGYSNAADRPAIHGYSAGNSTGLQGYSGTAATPAAPAKTGVFGYAAQDAGSRGVTGETTAGRGVNGLATTGTGVRGQSTAGTAGYFATTSPASGIALRADGRVKLDRCAGIATILSGTNSIVVTPGTDLVSTSAVTATLQGNPAGLVTVKSVAVNASSDTFTIYLTTNASANVKVAWHVFG